jgi:hypothetical protein
VQADGGVAAEMHQIVGEHQPVADVAVFQPHLKRVIIFPRITSDRRTASLSAWMGLCGPPWVKRRESCWVYRGDAHTLQLSTRLLALQGGIGRGRQTGETREETSISACCGPKIELLLNTARHLCRSTSRRWSPPQHTPRSVRHDREQNASS